MEVQTLNKLNLRYYYNCRYSVFFSTRNTNVETSVSVLVVKYRISVRFLADPANGRAIGTVLRLSVVCRL